MDSCGEYFLFYGLTDFMSFLVLPRRYGSSSCPRYFPSSFARSLGFRFAPSVHDDVCPKTDFLISFFRWHEEGATSVLGSQPIIWLPSSSFPCQATRVRSQSTDSLTHIFPSFNSQLKLTYILYLSFNSQSLASSNTDGSGNSLFLLS